MTDKELEAMLEQAERRGLERGIKIMQQRMILACKNGTPINIEERAYFIRSDLDNLRDIFAALETDKK